MLTYQVFLCKEKWYMGWALEDVVFQTIRQCPIVAYTKTEIHLNYVVKKFKKHFLLLY